MTDERRGGGDAKVRIGRLAIIVGVVAVGLLLWARVIVIHRMPRHAVADEESKQVEPLRSDESPAN